MDQASSLKIAHLFRVRYVEAVISQRETYRPDIDGLRALAVISVIAFHYGLNSIAGGFLGVDVFFVISGYLITSQLIADFAVHSAIKPNLLTRFYVRRFRRIMPALIAVLIATCAAGWFVMIPIDYASMGTSAVYSAMGLGNIYFAAHARYFDRAADLQPLIHLWSLGVEEQFYFVWPVILYLLLRIANLNKKVIFSVTFFGVIFSCVISIYIDAIAPEAAFYLTFFRAWELGAGALVAFCPVMKRRCLSEAMGVTGLLLVGYAILVMNETDGSLAARSLPAVIGAALLVYPRQQSLVAQVLGTEPLRQLGLISYSLYLWHWPILVFYRLTNIEAHPTVGAAAGLLAGTLTIAIASYFLIERPMRRQPVWRSASQTLAGLAIAIAVGLSLRWTDGAPSRLTTFAAQFADGANDYSKMRSQCHRTDAFNPPITNGCRYGERDSQPTIAIWGDSHAVEIGDAFGELAKENSVSIVGLSYTSCPPVHNYPSIISANCISFNRDALKFILKSATIKTVVLAAYYEAYFKERSFVQFDRGLEETVVALLAADKRVVIVASSPEAGYSVPQEATRLAMTGSTPEINVPIGIHRLRTARARRIIGRITAKYPAVDVIDPSAALCNEAFCPLVVGKHTVLYDSDHLSMFAARKVASAASFVVFGQ